MPVPRHSRRSRDDNGAATVEFALISIPLFFLLLGLIQYGWYFYVAETASGAASNVTRRLAVGDCWGSGEALALAQGQSPKTTAVTTSPSNLSSATEGGQITVTVTADANIMEFFPLPDDGVVTRTVKAVLSDKDVDSC